jgi:chemotaxis methyl-accepting protein methylase
VSRRIERRMGVHQIDKIVTYVRFLQDNPQELALLFKELLIGVTSFFRDSAPWEKLKTEVIPAILKDRTLSRTLRAWMIGCSTGEEAYSLAIVFKEALEQFKPAQSFSLQIFATDLDGDAIEKARAAVYPPNIAADVSPERLSAFFIKVEHGYQITKTIREMVIFASQNVILDPPFTKMDFVSCRNLLIYLSSELQKRLLPVFHYSLNPGGVLLLGSSETIGVYRLFFAAGRQSAALPTERFSRGNEAGRVSSRVSARSEDTAIREGFQTSAQSPIVGGPVAVAEVFPGSRARQRQGGHSLHQWANRQIPGAGSGQSELEHLCDGPRGSAL